MKKLALFLVTIATLAFCSCDPNDDTVNNTLQTSQTSGGSGVNPGGSTTPGGNNPGGDNPGGTGPTSSIGGFDENGASNALFSIASDRKVKLAKGNLQYRASTSTWRFAENQFDIVGSDNANIASDYNGWIDLFGWGTSGWNSGAKAYLPYSTLSGEEDYWVGGEAYNGLVGEYSNADWGVYNAIENGGNMAGMWRLLTRDEMGYLIFGRLASTVNGVANAHYAPAQVAGINGILVFPDIYVHPKEVPAPVGINSYDAAYTDNIYNIEQWSMMENAGCAFLPAAGCRQGTTVSEVNEYLYYWTSTPYCFDAAGVLMMQYSGYISISYLMGRGRGQSVRLVMDAE